MPYTTIKKPDDYFNTVLYTGNASTQSITGVNFQPDLTWIKDRSTANAHKLYDGVRGATKYLIPDAGDVEATQANGLTSFDSDGFSLGDYGGTNGSGLNFVSWNWLVSNTSGSSNTDGSITSNVAVNTTSGISIVTYTGTGANATVGHGLGVAPKVVLCKTLDVTGQSWTMYHAGIGATKELRMDTSGAAGTSSTRWQDTDPTANVFYVGTEAAVNYSSTNLVAYCFAEKQGYSKFGSYTGNGSSDGTFVYTGFKPAWVMTKRTDAISSWDMHDSKRDTYNVCSKHLLAEDTGAEGNTAILDFVSNGFKFRSSNADRNASGGTYIYMAFAEEPLVGDNPATAR